MEFSVRVVTILETDVRDLATEIRPRGHPQSNAWNVGEWSYGAFMTSSAQYDRLSSRFTDTVAAVPPDRWDSPSPCEEWTARDVIGHVVDTHTRLLSMAGVDPAADAPGVDADPSSAWTAVTAATTEAVRDPDVADREFDSKFGGVTTLSTMFSTFLAVDLVVHRWDLAKAADVDTSIAPEDLALVWEFARDKGDMMRTPGGFGPEVQVGPEVTEQERVLAFLGRSA